MADNPVPAIEKILTSAERNLRRSLVKQGLGELDHLVMAMTPAGAGVIRSSCDAEGLREMAAMLIEIANEMQGEARLN